MKQPSLFDGAEAVPAGDPAPPDQAARDFAIDPAHDVVLEASAGTGKTRVLVDRYVRLLESGVDPRHILAITFTRKAAAEMRDRVLATLNQHAARGTLSGTRWQRVRERVADVQISTIDAFCFGLLREFPLEADVDPAFDVADETDMARFIVEALDLTMRAARGLVRDDESVRLLLVRVKTPVLREMLGTLIDRRQVAMPAIDAFVRRHPDPATAAEAGSRFIGRLREALALSPRHRAGLLDDGPAAWPEFRGLAADLGAIEGFPSGDPVRVQHLRRRLDGYFLTQQGKPRQRLPSHVTASLFASADGRKRHVAALGAIAPLVAAALHDLDLDVDRLLARGLRRVLAIAVERYERLLDEHALLDFAGMLERAIGLLARQEEFARSRLKLQSRYHHLLVDEFQDTSRRQWRLIEWLVAAWAEGEGAADAATSIFIVGDRKQSIYRFRHAEATLLDEAAAHILRLRPGRRVREAITTSFRAVPELLAFVNALSQEMVGESALDERWTYGDADRFPALGVGEGALRDGQPVLGLIVQPGIAESAAAVADEIARILTDVVVRDRHTGPRQARPEDIAILFRARAGHQYFEDALEARGIRTYVYKGLGFFDAPEVQDLQALIRYLSQPDSDLRAAEFLRSRLVRLSDAALVGLAPAFADALRSPALDASALGLADLDARFLERARTGVARWLALADRVPPSELVDAVLRESAYVSELRGRRLEQARENVKKVRTLVRRVESRGYTTLGRLARYFDTLRTGDDSNAIVEAAGSVNLMTIHAAKGLEFPIVFVVNLHASGRGRPAGCSVIERGPSGEPEVTFGSTAATELEEQRDLEELRRLLYVAVTRSRDRLYLAAEIDAATARVKRGGRSLVSILPGSLTATMSRAGMSDAERASWRTPSGVFTFAVCRPADAPRAIASEAAAPLTPLAPVLPLTPSGPATLSATALAAADGADAADATAGREARDGRLVGTLVHRMFQRRLDLDAPDEAWLPEIRGLMRAVDLVDVASPDAAARTALDVYRSLRRQPDVARLLEAGTCHYEVPISFVAPDGSGAHIRGSVDCVVVEPDGGLTVLEFKTGRPRPEYERQAALYARALEGAFGRCPVRVLVCYP